MMMISLLKTAKTGFNNIWKGETTKRGMIETDEISDEGFVIVPNRKRNLIRNNNGSTSSSCDEPRKKKDSECLVVNESQTQEYQLDATAVADADSTEVEMAPCLNTTVEDLNEAALEGVPFIASPSLVQVYGLMKDQPPLCPNLPHVSFDFTLERTVLGR